MRWGAAQRVALLCLIAWLGCEQRGCSACGSPYLAELTQPTARVERDYADAVGQWKSCAAGNLFRLGDGLRTGPGATALLAMQPSGEVLVQENTTIRFELEEHGQGQRLEIEAGAVEVETAAVNLEVHSTQGLARIAPGSRVTIRAAQNDPTFVSVQAGRAVIEKAGETRTLEAGDELVLLAGEALLEAAVEKADLDESGAKQDEAETQTQRSGSEESPFGGPFEVPIAFGETATVHDPSPPTALGIAIQCAEGGLVEVARGNGSFTRAKARGHDHATVRLGPGLYRYRVRCLVDGKAEREVSAQGRIQLLADAATRRLPAKAQRVSIDADGRNYRIQYANRLPRFTITWRDAPPNTSYELNVTRPGRAPLRRSSREPRVVLPEGALRDGLHSYTWQTGDGASRSKTSTLQVTFENQGRAAYLNRSLKPGKQPGTVLVSGGAVTRSRVSINGTPVDLGPQGRFNTEVPVQGRSVVVRVVHPSSGVHYYVRRRP